MENPNLPLTITDNNKFNLLPPISSIDLCVEKKTIEGTRRRISDSPSFSLAPLIPLKQPEFESLIRSVPLSEPQKTKRNRMDRHDEQEHEVYGGEIPDEGDMEADVDMSGGADDYEGNDHDLDQDPNSNSKDLEDMKKRLKEIEDEAGALREMQAKVEKEMGVVQDASGTSATQAEKEEVDARSIYVGNVDYACTPEDVQQHFQSCGTVNRVTILTDKFGQPKGFAYVEFVEVDAVQNALLLNETELHGRQLKVSAKRTNVPGMKQYRGRRPNPFFRSRIPFMPGPVFYPPYSYGRVPRFRRPTRYRPY